ncbi:MAG: hypothetical protein UY39_C0005G0004 [Candidatus Kaiserbacteria bacterium GW2011_GWC2_49_12]|uniref:Trehalose 6-phosphate phosphatase n=4 Tax=Candidatus Kaiseribacteriota TaxID=1752734 RepID=A0A0G1WGI5_9BACT|nr:MAG: hypothetical protein UY39_C0005G0004 [Candidatus Kaiserbacteria bacterium GW2011_GWC2_49_12]KKW17908.1 MAG: hypothetical protein UY57_C0007G0008 [Candidatus Kaiserbacteria bacterium GW2011_GWB1_50_17]KKW18519.1 MAG: hypothetical protein UY59_C0004G0002 [Candidatus Kaiserbacteria bacterium GW2011_GWA1_50_28]OGG86487.1 MAG: trehalose-phosphatase [Candidatus Kaiserbacteria bacterium RIFCSPLOWO2_12_FULL_50_28]HCM43758.1 trehalose-phosphatase [Candidatus Kaiserbacteria bacterium]
MHNLRESRKKVLARVASAKHIALFLDFDGVLSPITRDHRKALIGARTKKLLVACAKQFFVAVISGRALKDVRRRVGIRGLSYGGNHGLEWKFNSKNFSVPVPTSNRRILDMILRDCRALSKQFLGLSLEDKDLTISIHYRMVSPRFRKHAITAISKVLDTYVKGGKLTVVGGHMLFNIRPNTRWDKGSVALWMLKRLPKGTLPISLGDDVTDEALFRTLRNGVTIRVGHTKKSLARYNIFSRREVDSFLSSLFIAKQQNKVRNRVQ